MAKKQKKTPSMQTVGEVRVIGDSGALHIANRQQFRSASGPVFLSSFRLYSASQWVIQAGPGWRWVGEWVGLGLAALPTKGDGHQTQTLVTSSGSQTGDAVINPVH